MEIGGRKSRNARVSVRLIVGLGARTTGNQVPGTALTLEIAKDELTSKLQVGDAQVAREHRHSIRLFSKVGVSRDLPNLPTDYGIYNVICCLESPPVDFIAATDHADPGFASGGAVLNCRVNHLGIVVEGDLVSDEFDSF